jgi:predicted methyltransferase MtxX (methanogen marker protein 4)
VTDDDGLELVDEKAAEQQAIETATSVARDAFTRGSADKVLVEVRNTHRQPFITVAVMLKVDRTD